MSSNICIFFLSQINFHSPLARHLVSVHFEIGHVVAFAVIPSYQRGYFCCSTRHWILNCRINSLQWHRYSIQIKPCKSIRIRSHHLSMIFYCTHFPNPAIRKAALFGLPRCVNGTCTALLIDRLTIACSSPCGAISITIAFAGNRAAVSSNSTLFSKLLM